MDYASFSYLRGRSLPSFDSFEDDDPKAMIFVVNDDKSIELADSDVIESVIESMLNVLAAEESRTQVEAWLDGRIRKLVKRGRNKQWTDLEQVTVFSSETRVGSATVKSFSPVPTSQVAPEIRKLQLTGLKTVSSPAKPTSQDALNVTISADLNMSVSKSAAQAAHAAQLFIMRAEEQLVRDWIDAGTRVTVNFGHVEDEGKADTIYVYDAGLTEIPAGSLTAVASFN